MKYTIGKWFAFEAAHSLPHLPEGHKCRNLHGHSYRVQLVLSSHALDENGFVTDYGNMAEFESALMRFDHKNLNDFLDPSTAEELARACFVEAERIYPDLTVEYVEVRETEKTFARYGR